MRNLTRLTLAFSLVCATLASAAPAHAETDVPTQAGETDSVYTRKGLFGSLRLGPTAGIGFPDGLRFGISARYRGVLGIGAAGAMIPEITIPGTPAQVSRFAGEGFVRIHPFQGAFFLGAAVGHATLRASVVDERMSARASASSLYVTPQMGFVFTLPAGFTVGFDVGVQIPFAAPGPSYEATKDGTTTAVSGSGAAADMMKYAATSPIPAVHLLDIGFLL